MRRRTCVLFFLSAIAASAQGRASAPAPGSTAELRQKIEDVLRKTHTPGAGVAIVDRGGPIWVAGIGLADVAGKKPVTPDTLFRIGSVSKGFVSLSVLKLQEEGKLSLQDTLKSRAPDLEFTNPWEATDPVRIVNLLEHTSGWDDMALREYAFNPDKEVTLKEGLAYNPKSRTSRWKPGTRFSYSNSGPPAAAYVIEKVTGERFEDYVEENWFKPLGMDTASYFDTPEVRSRLATLYHADGVTPYPYWHIILRPAGAINASASDMAKYLQFYLNRGSVGNVQLLPPEAIDRMEEPTTTYAAREGLKIGYGLGNYATVRRRIFHGHNGGVEGGLTELEYLPEQGMGYVFMINSGNPAALTQIDGLLRVYINRILPGPGPLPPALKSAKLPPEYAGWYEPISPRIERTRGLVRIAQLLAVTPVAGGLRIGLLGRARDFVPVTDLFYRAATDGAPTVALITDKSEGTLIEAYGVTFRRIPAWMPWLEFSVIAAAFLLMLSSLVFALIWVPRRLAGCVPPVEYIGVRAMPVLAALSLAGMGLLLALTGGDAIGRLGRITPWSVGIFVLSLAFAVFSVLGLALALRFWNRPMRRGVWWHAFAASLVLTGVAVYLAYYGVVGWRSWT
jgi:CubicO group peptidase (beta-lactamase class C family)